LAGAAAQGGPGFPVVNAFQPTYGGGPTDGVVFVFGEPEILVQPTTLNFKTPAGTTVSATVAISNVGVTNLVLNAIPAGPLSHTPSFSVVGGIPGGTVVTPGNRITLTINFSPTVPGTTFKDVLLIGSDDPDTSNVAVTLIGKS